MDFRPIPLWTGGLAADQLVTVETDQGKIITGNAFPGQRAVITNAMDIGDSGRTTRGTLVEGQIIRVETVNE